MGELWLIRIFTMFVDRRTAIAAGKNKMIRIKF
jgi:hypothetical protein